MIVIFSNALCHTWLMATISDNAEKEYSGSLNNITWFNLVLLMRCYRNLTSVYINLALVKMVSLYIIFLKAAEVINDFKVRTCCISSIAESLTGQSLTSDRLRLDSTS